MKEKSQQSEHRQDNDCLMLVSSSNKSKKSCVTQEYPAKSKKMTCKDKSLIFKKSSPKRKSSRILGQESTLRERDYLTSLIRSNKEELEKLWLPTKTDFVDSHSIYLNNSSRSAEHKSWFSMKCLALQNKNLFKTSQLSFMFSPVAFTDSGNTVKRSKKIRIYPNAEQRKKLRVWAGFARKSYNKTVEFLRQPNTKANRFDIQKDILASLGDCLDTPFKIKQMAIDDACNTVKAAKKKFIKTKQFQEVKFRSKKRCNDSLYVPKQAITEKGIYPRALGKIKHSEKLEGVKYDSRLLIEKDKFYIIIPVDKPILIPENQRKGMVALDPGARTFLTAYDSKSILKIGDGDFARIYRMLIGLDKLISKSSKKKTKYKRAIRCALFRIKSLIDELHKQTAAFLVKRYEHIVIPNFSSTDMVTKLRSKTCRNLLSFAHSKFREFLKLKCEEYSTKLTIKSEEYTSKTCGNCGHVQEIGSKKSWTCKNCSCTVDRDANGARNIYVLALLDTTLNS